jgi:hypothetical protein
MKLYNSSAGPKVRIKKLTQGMQVESMVGSLMVAAIVCTAVPSGETLLCQIRDLKVTLWHPVSTKEVGQWVFPADVAVAEAMLCNTVYSVLLQPDSAVQRTLMLTHSSYLECYSG